MKLNLFLFTVFVLYCSISKAQVLRWYQSTTCSPSVQTSLSAASPAICYNTVVTYASGLTQFHAKSFSLIYNAAGPYIGIQLWNTPNCSGTNFSTYTLALDTCYNTASLTFHEYGGLKYTGVKASMV
jgi:hypothetical protein